MTTNNLHSEIEPFYYTNAYEFIKGSNVFAWIL